jgi:hypothetical protein
LTHSTAAKFLTAGWIGRGFATGALVVECILVVYFTIQLLFDVFSSLQFTGHILFFFALKSHLW